MPYSGTNDPKLPKYVLGRSQEIREKWISVFNVAFAKYGEDRAFLIANTWLKTKVTKKAFVKRSTLYFEVYNQRGFFKRDRNGEDYITLVLNTTKAHRDGIEYTEQMLKDWEKQINNNPIVGDIDHLFYDKILNSTMTDEQVKSALKGKQGIAKTVRAVYQKGKLWIRAIVDKRYKRLIEKSKGVSSEAFLTWNGNIATAGEILGFTFNINTTPADYLAGVVA